jgi:hypothetical protein
MNWTEFFYSIYGLFTVGIGSLMIGVIIGLNLPIAKRRDNDDLCE